MSPASRRCRPSRACEGPGPTTTQQPTGSPRPGNGASARCDGSRGMANDPPRWESDDCDDPIHERHWADVVSLSWAFCADDDESWPCAAILVHEAAVGYVPPARPVAAPRDGHANPSGALESPGPLTAQQLTDGPLSTTWRPGRRGSTRHQKCRRSRSAAGSRGRSKLRRRQLGAGAPAPGGGACSAGPRPGQP